MSNTNAICKHCESDYYDNESDYCSEQCELEALNDNYNLALNRNKDLEAQLAKKDYLLAETKKMLVMFTEGMATLHNILNTAEAEAKEGS